jgi:tetraprenyl-beta-curcumene synthase
MGASTLGNRQPVEAPDDRRPVARAGLALALANVRYWTSVAPIVRGELRRWESRARAIDDPELRALALQKLRGEGFHAEAAAMLATLAPRSYRRDVVEAIVALELLFDYLDGLTERPSADPLGNGQRLFEAYTDALAAGSESDRGKPRLDADEPAQRDDLRWVDGGYLEALSGAVGAALERLPASGAIAQVARASAARSAQAQIRMHAASVIGIEQVEEWARREAEGTDLEWRELLAGAASSVLALHALIAAAADPATTPVQAAEIDAAYLSTCTVLTLLDGLVDHEQDRLTGDRSPAGRLGETGGTDGAPGIGALGSVGYIDLYEDSDELPQTLTDAAKRAATQARALPNGPHHAMTLVGAVAYYTSDPGARGKLAAPIVKRLHRQLAPLIYPTLWLMRSWRLAKRVRAGNRRAFWSRGLASSLGKSRGIGGVK